MSQQLDMVIKNGTVVLGSGQHRLAVGIKDGKIVALAPEELLPEAKQTVDASGLHVLPGVVDSESHPGCYVPFKMDMETESKAAACAGVTTWGIQAPCTRLGTEPFIEVVQAGDVGSFNDCFPSAVEVIEDVSYTDCYLTYMLETDQHANEIPQYAEEHGVTSYKLYLQTRGMKSLQQTEDSNWPARRAGLGVGIDDGTVFLVMENVAHLGHPAICHIHPENWEIAQIFEQRLRDSGREDFAAWTDRSPDFLEAQHVHAYSYMANHTPGHVRLYLQHATTPLTFDEIAKARADGLELYAQTGPAWLWLEPQNGWRINVPLRRRENIEALWKAIGEGIVDVVGSDHVVGWEPSSYEEMYNPSIWSCRTGFSRVEMMLPVMLSEGVNANRLSLERVVQVICENPAKTAGLWGKKGSLLPGFDADVVLVDLSREVDVTKDHINTRSNWSLMEGHKFKGWPVKTIMRGEITAEWADDSPGMRVVGEPQGTYLKRSLDTPMQGSAEIDSPVRVSRTNRWLADKYDRPGFCPETMKYSKPRGA